MKKLLFLVFVGLILNFYSTAQTQKFGNWKVVKDEYRDLTTLETNIIEPAWTKCRIVMIIERDGTMGFLLKEQGSNYQEFSTEQLYRIGWVDAYITINGKKERKGTIVSNGLASAVNEWVNLFRNGTKGALKYENIGHYYEFSLTGFPQAYEYFMKTVHGIDIKKREQEEKERAEKLKQQQIELEKERLERLAEEKRQQELLEQKRNEIIAAIEAKIPDQILEASEIWVKNESVLTPLNTSRRNILDRLEKALINHFSQDTVNIHVISSSSIDNDFLKSLNQGNHSIKGNLNENTDYPFSEEFKKEIRQKSLVKGKAVDVYKPFRIDFIIEVKDSILTETNYYSSNNKKPVFLKGKQEFYYKTSSNLTAIELKFDSAIPKDMIEVIEFYKYEKRLNDFIVAESKYKVSYKKAIQKKEK
jgi:hypothetical protein